MTRTALLGPLLIVIAVTSAAAQPSVQQSHIEANVPPPASFQPALQRDLLVYFKASIVPAATSVEYELLRKEPTQSGVANPKFYAWVKVRAGSASVLEGAVRVAAAERTHFDVTNFLSVAQLAADPAAARLVFPEALVASVLQRAGVR